MSDLSDMPEVPVPAALMEAFQADIAGAEGKYKGLVEHLSPTDLIGLWHVVRERVERLADEGRREAIAQGWRPPGTRLGR